MDKKRLYRIWRYFRKIHPWYFLITLVIFGAISVVALRNNNERMDVLRHAVYQADEKGDRAELEAALKELRQFVYGHMNTSLTSGANAVHPPIQLKYTYEREQAERQKDLGTNNAGLYHEAQQACAAENPNSSGAESIACIERFASQRGVQLSEIPDALYKFDFVSAKWSPDLAGWSLLLAILSLIAFLVSSFTHWAAKKYL